MVFGLSLSCCVEKLAEVQQDLIQFAAVCQRHKQVVVSDEPAAVEYEKVSCLIVVSSLK